MKRKDNVYHTKIDGMESYEIYLSNFKGIKYNGKNELDTLCSILTSESMEELKEIVGNYRERLILMSELEKLKLNDEFNSYYAIISTDYYSFYFLLKQYSYKARKIKGIVKKI